MQRGELFSTYPHQPTPVDPGLLVFSIGLSNTPIIGDFYDLYTGVTGYDPITGQYLAGWERLANIADAIPILGLSGANIRHGVHAAESLIDSGDELAQFIGKACSFDEDTPVATDEGAIPIREVDVGDRVLAWNETLGETSYYTVTAVWGHEDPVTVQLVINGETIDTTPEHPFLTADGMWVMAGELTSGDQVRSAAGDVGVVEMVTFVTVPQQMYNLTVAVAHTFFVGAQQWLVHNCNLPQQVHHFATNKSSKWTSEFEKITNKYGLDLDDDWNKELLPHLGRHPNDYHQWVLQTMEWIDDVAKGNKQKFLELFEEEVKSVIRDTSDMLYKQFWQLLD